MSIMKPSYFQTFMGIDFLHRSRSEVRSVVREAALQKYTYLVTPNVDDLVKTLGGFLAPHHSRAFLKADYKICDSKILQLLSWLVGKPLRQYPGSDLVKDLLADPSFNNMLTVVIGPSAIEFAEIVRLYPNRRFTFVESPTPLRPGTEAWQLCLKRLLEEDWNIALICLPLPRQQLIAEGLRERGRQDGIALCVGASVDFLSGKQKRAPAIMQFAGLEWLYRLATNPRRLWRRYLIEGPTIFPLFISRELLPWIRGRLRNQKN